MSSPSVHPGVPSSWSYQSRPRVLAPTKDVILAVAALLAGSGLFLDILPENAYDAYWLIFLVIGIVVLRRFGVMFAWTVITRQPFLCVVLATALLSLIWSPDPWLTCRGAVALIGTTLVGLFVGQRFSEPVLLEVLAKTFLCILLISIAVAALAPGYAIEPFDRGYLPFALKGAARHRNSLGAQAALIITFVGASSLTGALTRTRSIVIGGVASVVLVLAQSMTAITATACGLVLLLLFWGARRLQLSLGVVLSVVLALAAVAGAAFLLDPGGFAEALGRDPHFTERDLIWADALRLIAGSPLLGQGYDAIWGRFEATYFHDLPTLSWAPHAHNGYLQLATEIGVPAALLAFAYLLGVTRHAFGEFARRGSTLSLFALAATVMCLFMNSSETWLFVPYEILWSVYVALATALLRQRQTAGAATISTQ